MDKTLLDGLPLSSSIAVEVLKDAERKYEAHVAQVREAQHSFDEERQQAFLTARCGRRESGHLVLSGLGWNGYPITYTLPEEGSIAAHVCIFEHEVIPEAVCQQAGLSVGTGIESRDWSEADVREWSVWAWIPSGLSRDERKEVRELLPLPERRLEEWEWILVFWAMAKVSETTKEGPRVAIHDPEDETVGPIIRLLYRLWPAKLQRCDEEIVIEEFLGDASRFREGRAIVDNALLRECVSRSLQRAREKTQFDLIAFNGSERPAFLPTAWESSYWPAADKLEAARQWLGCAREMLLQWQASFQGAEANDFVSDSMARQVRNDAWLLACHVRDSYGIKIDLQKPSVDSLFEVTQYLDSLRQAISESSGEVAWSISRSPSDWLKVFEKLNLDCRSLDVFSRRRTNGTYRQHPDSTTKSVRLALGDLPKDYSDTMNV